MGNAAPPWLVYALLWCGVACCGVACCGAQEPLTARREALYSALRESEGQLHFATAKTSRDVEELQVRYMRGAWPHMYMLACILPHAALRCCEGAPCMHACMPCYPAGPVSCVLALRAHAVTAAPLAVHPAGCVLLAGWLAAVLP